MLQNRRLFLGCLTAFVIALSVTPAHAGYNQIVAFGDSLSDNGNLSALFAPFGVSVPASPYSNGRFTNGDIWLETMSQGMGTPLVDLAYGGSYTDSNNVTNALLPPGTPFTVPGMNEQVAGYLAANPTVDSHSLYVVWGGANDFLNGVTDTNAVVNNITTKISALADAGATTFLVPNLPLLGDIPLTSQTPLANALNLETQLYNSQLQAALLSLQSTTPSLRLIYFDVNSYFQDALANPGKYGFTNVTDNYINSGNFVSPTVAHPGDDVNDYLFWDELHPTTKFHQVIGQKAILALAPEPGSGLLALVGVAGIVARRRRKATTSR